MPIEIHFRNNNTFYIHSTARFTIKKLIYIDWGSKNTDKFRSFMIFGFKWNTTIFFSSASMCLRT